MNTQRKMSVCSSFFLSFLPVSHTGWAVACGSPRDLGRRILVPHGFIVLGPLFARLPIDTREGEVAETSCLSRIISHTFGRFEPVGRPRMTKGSETRRPSIAQQNASVRKCPLRDEHVQPHLNPSRWCCASNLQYGRGVIS
jgi:hypothetical protein